MPDLVAPLLRPAAPDGPTGSAGPVRVVAPPRPAAAVGHGKTHGPVAFYVHHHGAGHANRAKLLAARWPAERVHVFTSAAERFVGWSGGRVHALPPDVAPGRDPQKDLLQNRVLHYAPVGLPSLSERMAKIAAWIADARPSLFIVDLSVEVALFARLCGARTALVRLHGHRDDPAHTAAFGLCDRLVAPFPEALDDPHTPDAVRRMTVYLGAFSRYDGRTLTRAEARRQIDYAPAPDRRLAVVINGSGGADRDPDVWCDIAGANPSWDWLLVGRVPVCDDPPANLHHAGYQKDTFPFLRAADVVVGSGGTNTMMEVGAARTRFVSLPEPRPFDEQLCKMQALSRLGLTEVCETRPAPDAWAPVLDAALRQDPSGWDRLFAEDALASGVAELQTPVHATSA